MIGFFFCVCVLVFATVCLQEHHCCVLTAACCVSLSDGVYQNGTALGRGRQAGLGSAQGCAPLCVHVPQQLCSHPILLLLPAAPAAAENMGQFGFLAH